MPYLITCEHCGKEATAARSTKQYCSSQCRVAAHRENKRNEEAIATARKDLEAAVRRALGTLEYINRKAKEYDLKDEADYGLARIINEAARYRENRSDELVWSEREREYLIQHKFTE